MVEKNLINIIDFGASKIRFSVFDSQSTKKFSESINVSLKDKSFDKFHEIQNIIKKAEKTISSHIENIILIFDCNKIFSIDISLSKKIDKKLYINEIYNLVLLELNQIINSNYISKDIIHVILNKCYYDNQTLTEMTGHKILTKNAKFEFKVLCYPKDLLKELKKKFNSINLNITNFFCTNYIKTFSYQSKLDESVVSFLEIGFERSCITIYDRNKLKFIYSIPVGGHHITKDISKIFKISLNDAEKIKKSFNHSQTEFSYQTKNEEIEIDAKDLISNNISVNLLKKVILYRIQEIIDLIFKETISNKPNINLSNSNLYLIGEGSKLLINNSFYLTDKFNLKSIKSYNETDENIFSCASIFCLNQYKMPEITVKNQGLFEKFFNFFGK